MAHRAIPIRLSSDELALLDQLAALHAARTHTGRTSRGAVIRALLARGLPALSRELGGTP